MADNDLTFNLSRVCPVCGKKFLPVQLHSWKDKTDPNGKRLVCTYPCMRETERRVDEARGISRVDPETMTEKQRQKWLCRDSLKCQYCRFSHEVVGESETSVFCMHPNRESISAYWIAHHMPNKIGYLGTINKSGEYHFKKTPKWCPIRLEVLAK